MRSMILSTYPSMLAAKEGITKREIGAILDMNFFIKTFEL